MLHARRQVSEIIRPHRIRLVPIVQNTFACQNEINLFFAIVVHGLTISVGIERNFREPGHTSQEPVFRIAFAEDWLVVASRGCHVSSGLAQIRKVAMQPRGIDFPVLSQEVRNDEQC